MAAPAAEARRRAAATPAEPEVIKKGKKEEEARPRRKSRPRRRRGRRSKNGFWFLDAGFWFAYLGSGGGLGTLDAGVRASWWWAWEIRAKEYEYTAHNLGFLVVDRLAERNGIKVRRKDSRALVGQGTVAGKRVLLAKPQTFMNVSGESVQGLLVKHEIAPRDLILVYDELDLPWRSLRIRPNGSAAGPSRSGFGDPLRLEQRISPGFAWEFMGAVAKRTALKLCSRS